MKRCTKCKRLKDEIAFRRKKTAKDGLCCLCKECEYPYLRQYYQKNKEYFRQYKKDNPKKFGTYFYIEQVGAIPEKIKKLQKKLQKRYFEKHRNEKEFKKRKSRNKQDYMIRHPERCREILFKQKSLSHAFTVKEWKEKVKDTKGICPICNRPFEEGYNLSLDHIIPVSKAPLSFTYTIDDVQPICLSCNCAKGNEI